MAVGGVARTSKGGIARFRGTTPCKGIFHDVLTSREGRQAAKTGVWPVGAKSPLLQVTDDGCRYELINHKPLK